MAGDWIKMRGNLWDDPRVARLCDLTDQTEASIVGALYWLWATADQHTEDGAMPGLTLRQIDRKTGVQGFGAALCEIGWLRDDPDGVVLEKFEEHNGTSAKRRCTDAQRKATSRNVSANDADIAPTDSGQKTPCLGAREEKRREEIEQEQQPTVVVERSAPDPSGYRVPDCPYDRLLNVYHEALPMLPRVVVFNGPRRASMRSRWVEVCSAEKYETDDGVQWFRDFLWGVRKSRFLTGNSSPSPGRQPFKADLEWLLRPSNFAKVVEGRYHGETA